MASSLQVYDIMNETTDLRPAYTMPSVDETLLPKLLARQETNLQYRLCQDREADVTVDIERTV